MDSDPPTAAPLLAWYDRNRRHLPWRARPGETPDPYRVWLSEIMLQQTTVGAAGPFFQRFTSRWPTVADLAQAPLDEVLTEWAGLGYYARARNLHHCAQLVAARPGGRFPDSEEGLRDLPGIGPYTAAAIAAIAFDRPASPVDGNIERVTARLFAVTTPLPRAKPELRRLAATLTPRARAGDHAQALMDLGATVCVPGRPRCALCPLADGCRARALGIAADLPSRAEKPERPERAATALWILDGAGAVLLRRRPPRGLLGGMAELPSTPWRPGPPPEDAAELDRASPVGPLAWRPLPGRVRHTFTHFRLELALVAAIAPPDSVPAEGAFVPPSAFGDHPLPSVMRKLIALALAAPGGLAAAPS